MSDDIKDALIRAKNWDALDAEYAKDQRALIQRKLAEALGDPKTITPEVVAWAQEKAKSILAAGSRQEDIEAARAEARERTPYCGWSFHILRHAMAGKPMEPFLSQTPALPEIPADDD